MNLKYNKKIGKIRGLARNLLDLLRSAINVLTKPFDLRNDDNYVQELNSKAGERLLFSF